MKPKDDISMNSVHIPSYFIDNKKLQMPKNAPISPSKKHTAQKHEAKQHTSGTEMATAQKLNAAIRPIQYDILI